MRPLLRDGGLVDETSELAMEMWTTALKVQQESATEVSERELFHLTELLADHHSAKLERLKARSILEAAIETLENPQYLQPLYCWLARNASYGGDHVAARQWLDLCDERSRYLDNGQCSQVRLGKYVYGQ